MKLLSPIQVGPMEIRNRVVSTAHAAFIKFWEPGNSGERYMDYQERRAQGGTGLIIMTAMTVHPSSQFSNHYVPEAADLARKYREMSARVHKHGAKIIQQVLHWGANEKSDARDDFHPIWGWSPVITPHGEPVHEMTDDEIEEVIESFVQASVLGVENGLDGIELHGTHGYLIQQAFSPYANKRTDRWADPHLFIKLLAQRVRAAIGRDKLLGFRISADDWVRPEDGGLGHQRLCSIAAEVIGTGLFDYLNHSMGTGGTAYSRAIGSYRHKFGEFLPQTRGLREAIGGAVPTIGVGKIPTPEVAEKALQDGDCDMVGMTRAQIADPDLVRKLMEGQGSRIRTCTGSNQGCYDRARYPITCFHNPEVGEEKRFRDLDAPVTPKRVLVVGGGPAGIKAAEIAAKRGHHVTLAESGSRLGGRLNLVGQLGDAANLLTSVTWIENELALLKVDIRLRTPVDEAFVRAFAPDAIIMATGAVSSADLDVPSDGSVPVISGDDAVEGIFGGQKFEMGETSALVIDIRANYETALVIEAIAKRGAKVTVVTPHLHWGANVGPSHRHRYMLDLPKLGVEMLVTSKLEQVRDGEGYLRNLYSQALDVRRFDFIVAGAAPKPRTELLAALKRIAPTTAAGDMIAPRSAMEAYREGDRRGRMV